MALVEKKKKSLLLKSNKKQDIFDPSQPTVSIHETELFDRIKQHIGTKPSYEEFLKTLNLYTQQILDLDTLMVQLHPFLGSNPDLFHAFQSMIGYKPCLNQIEKPAIQAPKPDLLTCKKVSASASYRQVPKDVSKISL